MVQGPVLDGNNHEEEQLLKKIIKKVKTLRKIKSLCKDKDLLQELE